jgi:hypothetical protein
MSILSCSNLNRIFPNLVTKYGYQPQFWWKLVSFSHSGQYHASVHFTSIDLFGLIAEEKDPLILAARETFWHFVLVWDSQYGDDYLHRIKGSIYCAYYILFSAVFLRIHKKDVLSKNCDAHTFGWHLSSCESNRWELVKFILSEIQFSSYCAHCS